MEVCNLLQNSSFPYHYFLTKRPHVGSTTVHFSLVFLILSGFHHPSRRINKHQDIIMFPWRVNSVASYHIGSFWFYKNFHFTLWLSWLEASRSYRTRLVPWWPSSSQKSGEMNHCIPWKHPMDQRQFWNIFQASCVLATVVIMVIVHQVNIEFYVKFSVIFNVI